MKPRIDPGVILEDTLAAPVARINTRLSRTRIAFGYQPKGKLRASHFGYQPTA
jgi:hypothetical protein